MSKRSSILKPQRNRNAFEDVTMDSPGPKDGDTVRFSRKVRFSSNFVKTFVTEDEGKDTIWDKTYEEVIEDSAQTTSADSLNITKRKEIIVDKDKEQSYLEIEEDKENDLNFSVNTSLFQKSIEKFTVFNDEEHCSNKNQTLFDMSIKSKVTFTDTSQTSFQSLNESEWVSGRGNTEIENALKVDDFEISENYTKAYEKSNQILFEKQKSKLSENTRNDLEITASIPLQFDDEVLRLDTSQNEIEFTKNQSTCLNEKGLEFTKLMLKNRSEALEKSNIFPDENLDLIEQVENSLLEEKGLKKTIDFEKPADKMEFTIPMPQLSGNDSKKTILFSTENNDLEMTEQIGNNLLNDNSSRKTIHFPKSADDMEFTMQIPQLCEKDSRKTIVFSSENDGLEMTEQIGNTLLEEKCSRKTIHFPKSADDMEFTMQMPQLSGKDSRKTILFSSENNDLEMTEQVGNKLLEEKCSRKTIHFPKSADDMEFTMQIPQLSEKKSRKTILFSSENNDLEMTEQIGDTLLDDKSSRKTIHFPRSADEMEFTMQIPQVSGKDSRKTILFSSENNDLEITEQIGNKLLDDKSSRKTIHFPKSADEMEFTMQMPQASGKDSKKTILFSSENNDLEMTEQIENHLLEDNASRKTIYFPKSVDEITIQIPQLNENNSGKTVQFPSGNDLEINNKLLEFGEPLKKIADISKFDNDVQLTKTTEIAARKSVVSAGENNILVNKVAESNFVNGEKSNVIGNFNEAEIIHCQKVEDMEFAQQLSHVGEKISDRESAKNNLFSAENKDLELTKKIEQQAETDRNNLIAEEFGNASNKIDSRKTMYFSKSSKDIQFTMELPSLLKNKAEINQCTRKTILFSSDNNSIELTEKKDLNLFKNGIEEKSDVDVKKTYDGISLELGKQINKKTNLFSDDNNQMNVTERMDTSFNDIFVKTSTQTTKESVKNQFCITAISSNESVDKDTSLKKNINNFELTEVMDLCKPNWNKEVLTLIEKKHHDSSENDDMEVTESNCTSTALECQKTNLTGIKLDGKNFNFSSDIINVPETVDLNLILEKSKLTKSRSINTCPDVVSHVTEEEFKEKSIMLVQPSVSTKTKDKFETKETEIDDMEMVDEAMLVDTSDENIKCGEEFMDSQIEIVEDKEIPKEAKSIFEFESSNCDFNRRSSMDVNEERMQCQDDTYIEVSSTCLQDSEIDVSSCDSSTRKRTLESVHKSCKKISKESNSFTEMSSAISFSESCGDFSRTANVTPRVSLSNFDATVNFTMKLDQTVLQESDDLPKVQYINYDLNDILRRIGHVHVENNYLGKSNNIISEFRNEMRKYEALLTHIRNDLVADQKMDVNPVNKPFFEATAAAHKTIREEVEEKQKLCNESFSAVFPKEGTCEVRALFRTVLIRMEFDEMKGLVHQTEVVNKLSPKATPIIRYVHRLLLNKINDVKASLGNSFSILTLLDYIHLHQGEVLRQREVFEEMCKLYYIKRRHDMEMDENFNITWHIVELRLGFSCIVRMDPSKLSSEHIVIQSEIGYLNNCEILELAIGCGNSLFGIRKFVDRVSRMLVARGEEEHATYMAKYHHLFN